MDIKIVSKDKDVFTINRCYLHTSYFMTLFDYMAKGIFKVEDTLDMTEFSSAAIRIYIKYLTTGFIDVKELTNELSDELDGLQNKVEDEDFKFHLLMTIKLASIDFSKNPFEDLEGLATANTELIQNIRKKYFFNFLNEVHQSDPLKPLMIINLKLILNYMINNPRTYSTYDREILMKELYKRKWTMEDNAKLEGSIEFFVAELMNEYFPKSGDFYFPSDEIISRGLNRGRYRGRGRGRGK